MARAFVAYLAFLTFPGIMGAALADEPRLGKMLAPSSPEIRTVERFPVFPAGVTEYVVGPSDATLWIERLIIPDGHSIKVDPSVTSIDWTVRTIAFGRDATIDLRRSTSTPPKASNGPPPPGQVQDYGKAGLPGSAGAAGSAGVPGADLLIRELASFQSQGSLWIRTDGGSGGAGGDGGQGQTGGGPHNPGAPIIGKKAGRGGAGGPGGPGGAGGSTSRVEITFRPSVPRERFQSGCSDTCGPSQRPPAAVGESGVMAIWGAPGCGGAGGAGGPGGPSGDSNRDSKGYADPGPGGPGGRAGADGVCAR